MSETKDLLIVQLETELGLLLRQERNAKDLVAAMPAGPQYREAARQQLQDVQIKMAEVMAKLEAIR